ncbi:MAG TPA: hypothetical protein ENN79_08740 [Desulfobacteraceae bacterium]|nr:hypothetical protein [Desulfobacteraceae bacterium]
MSPSSPSGISGWTPSHTQRGRTRDEGRPSDFGRLAKSSNARVIPGNITDLAGMVTAAMTALKKVDGKNVQPE